MAHTLQFSQNRHGTNVVTISDRQSQDGEWLVIYKDNLTVITEDIPGNRRVYQVREWIRGDQCRATPME